jgi:ligand-binding sensor domain-containing protein/signal transduction histidine kinase
MNKLIHTILVVLIFFSCVRQQGNNIPLAFNPVVVEAFGKLVPIDSMESPKTIPTGKPKVIRAGTPTVVFTIKNEYPAGKPTIVVAGILRSITPGEDTFLLPKQVRAIENPFLSKIPEVVIAKDAYFKDQNPQNFSTFNKQQGLKYSSVHCQMQDKNGNLWFGTYGGGASKYDGKSFTHFTEKEGLSNNRVWSIIEDKNGNIWFGTDDGGVSKYDGKSFTNFTEKEGLSNNTVLSILQDKNGSLWFGTNGGVSKYDGRSFIHYTEKEGLSNNSVLSILEDKKGNLWFGTGNGVSKYDGKSFTNFTQNEGLINNAVLSIFQDKTENLWFGTNGGVSKYNGKSFMNFTEKEGLSNNKVYSIFQDINGAIWLGTGGGGVSKLLLKPSDGYTGKSPSKSIGSFTHYTENEGLCNNIVYNILQDKNNNLWFGTNVGVSKYGGKTFTHFTWREGLNNNKVLSILKDRCGNLWFGTFGGGVSKYDGKSFTHFTQKEGLSNNNVFSIIQDKNGNLWFGTDGGGVSKYDGRYFTHFTTKEGLSNNKVYCILEDKTGNLWFGTYGGGVSKYDGKSFTHFTQKEGLCNNFVLSICQDNTGNIWFGTDGGGVSKLVPNVSEVHKEKSIQTSLSKQRFINFTKKEGLSNNYVLCILQDKNNNLWFGTGGGGVSKYDGKTFTYFTEKEGLSNDHVLSILQDINDNLWFGTRFGLSKLKVRNLKLKANNPELSLFNNYEYEDGFLGTGCTRGAICQDNTGIIWIGTNDRLTAYHPEGDQADTVPPNIQLTGIELFNEKINWSYLLSPSSTGLNRSEVKDTSIILGNGVHVTDFRFNQTSKWNGMPQNLSLRYNNNNLTFTFIGITHKQSTKVKYQYQLEGLDKNWSATTQRNEASYGNLSPGKYSFKIKAVNGEGLWSKESAYSFTIRPPWWKSGWFWICMALFIFTSLIILYRWRIASLLKRQKLLELIVEEKTIKVVRQSLELHTINEELLLQKKELEIAVATKDKFFSIIAHDLRGPLGGFMGLSEMMADESVPIEPDERMEMTKALNQSARNIYNLLENLLKWSQMQHGRTAFKPQVLDLSEAVSECLKLFVESSHKKSIQLVDEISDGCEVFADTNMLQTIIRNMVSNAIKFTARGGRVSISAKFSANNTAIISVKDEGIGMSSEMIANLFRINVNNGRSGTEGERSTGLGLLLCKEFAEKHGGKIWVESEVGKGTIFYFTMPALQ